jgi:hypothetical protein
MVVLEQLAHASSPARTPPSMARRWLHPPPSTMLGSGEKSNEIPRPPARRSHSAPGLKPPQGLLRSATQHAETMHEWSMQPEMPYKPSKSLEEEEREWRASYYAEITGDVISGKDSVPTMTAIVAASRRPGRVAPGPPGSLTSSKSTSRLRQSASVARLSMPPTRDPASAATTWPPYHDPERTGFSKDLASLSTTCSTAFQSRAPRLIHDQRGAYAGHDARALLADTRFNSFHLNHQYEGTDLVTAYRASGIVQSTTSRSSFAGAKDYGSAAELPATKQQRRTRSRYGGTATPGTASASDLGAPGSSAGRPNSNAVFRSTSPRLSPTRTFSGSDPRALLADDPFDGRHAHQYQPAGGSGGYFASVAASAEAAIARAAPQSRSLQRPQADASGRADVFESTQAKNLKRENAPLLAAAAKAGLAPTRYAADPRAADKYFYESQAGGQAGGGTASFHSNDDGFRYGVLIRQPSRPNAPFASGLPRLTEPKPLEPFHRDRYGAELNVRELSCFPPRSTSPTSG